MERVDAAFIRQTQNTLDLAHQLGGIPIEFKGPDVGSAVAAFAKEYAITYVVLGRTQRPWYRRWFGQSVLDKMLRAMPDVDFLVVDTG
jgi:two-component system sensor histidine kinase KdpD